MGHHDLSYRLFFTHRLMIQDLLRKIVDEPWVERIDLDSAERVNASFVSGKHENRESDVICCATGWWTSRCTTGRLW